MNATLNRTPRPRRWWLPDIAATIATIILAGLGGAMAAWIDAPLPWLIGSMLAVAIAATAGANMQVPAWLIPIVFVALGIQSGAGVSPQALALIGKWPLSLLGLAMAVPLISWAGSELLCWRGWDRESALLASVPGALSVIMAVSAERGADTTRIAIVQTMRVAFLILLLPLMITVGAPPTPAVPAPMSALAILAGLCAMAGAVAARIKLPGGWVVGSMLASTALHGSGASTATLPPLVANIFVVLLGAMVGSRFAGLSRRLLTETAVTGLALFGLTTGLATAAALLVALATGIPAGQAMLAFAPGALEAMLIMATIMHLDPAYVGVHHVMRFIGISLILPVILRLRPNQLD